MKQTFREKLLCGAVNGNQAEKQSGDHLLQACRKIRAEHFRFHLIPSLSKVLPLPFQSELRYLPCKIATTFWPPDTLRLRDVHIYKNIMLIILLFYSGVMHSSHTRCLIL